LLAQFGIGGVQRQRQGGFDPLCRQALEHPRVANGGKHQVALADTAFGAEQVDRLQHVIQVVRRFAHAHEDHFLHRAKAPRQSHLGDDLGGAQLAQQAALAGHAEHAAHRATDLAGYA
jgi:hypothetical protein